jgi:DNA invertase Pin-like site-specific DNA recombinase
VIVDGYVRVSQVAGRSGERFISPAVQREQIERWAAGHGALIAHVFEELDESGGRPDRPLLQEAIARVERGDSGGIVVAYLSRFGRSILAGLQAIERITSAGGAFVSVQDGLDFSTDTGRLHLRFMFSVAEWELDRTRAAWRAAAERAVERGVSPAPVPFGYRRSTSGRLEPHPVNATVVAELFRQRALGSSVRELSEGLVERGVRSPRGNAHWNESSLKRLFARRVYLGEAHYGSAVNARAHPALVDRATWGSAQFPVTRRVRRTPAPKPLLDGILRCAGCQRPLQSRSHRLGWSDAAVHYCCGHADPPVCCPSPAQIRDALVEPYVLAVFWQEASSRGRPAPSRLSRLEGEAARRREELLRYRDNHALPITLGPERFAEGLSVRQRRLDRAEAELSRTQLATEPPAQDMMDLRGRWPSMTDDQRRIAVAQVIECAFVGRKGQPPERRIAVYPRGRAPLDLPSRTSVAECPPFDPAPSPPTQLRRRPERWSHARVRDELEALVRGRDRWPSFGEFQRAGLAELYGAVERDGGQRAWAWTLGVRYAPYDKCTWTEERVRAELAKFLDGRSSWPTEKEFRAAGLRPLREAARVTGGLRRWAEQLGFELCAGRADPRPWTYERMRTAIAQFTADRGDWPTQAEFHEAGHRSLYDAIRRTGVREELAADLDLRLRPGAQRIAGYWTEPKIDAALRDFLRGRDTWPSRCEFRAEGLGTLAEVIDASGRRRWWAHRHAVTPTYRWFKTTISKALDAFLEGREHWPSNREFAAADLSDLRHAIHERGETELWMDRYGLRPRGHRGEVSAGHHLASAAPR